MNRTTTPARAALAAAGLLLVLTGCGHEKGDRSNGPLVPAWTPPPATPPPTTSTSSALTSSGGSPASGPAGSGAGTLVPEPASQEPGDEDYPSALDVARRWVQAWCHPPEGTPTAAWVERVKDRLHPGQWVLLDDIEPQNITSTRITGPVQAVSTHPGAVVADVPTDDEPVRVTVVHWEGTWLVNAWN